MAVQNHLATQNGGLREGEPQIVETCQEIPGCCAVTGTADGPFLDTGLWVYEWGRVYISLRALKDTYGVAGWTSREKTAEMRERMRKLEAENEELRGRLVAAVAAQTLLNEGLHA